VIVNITTVTERSR